MRVRFQPFLGLSIATAFLFAALIGLGVWQVQRLHWKLDLIASVDRNLRAPPLSLSKALAMGDGAAQYHRVAIVGRFDNDKEAYVFATDANGDPAYHVIVPFKTDLGTFLVDRGIVPPGLRPPGARRSGVIDRVTQVVGVWRTPDPPGLFTPAAETAHRVWYSRDLKAIARADRISLREPVIIEADSAPNPGGWPKGGQTLVQFRNEHLQYAITWFALAAALLAVYFAYHRAKGRLSLG